jgi:hypothetical protein
VMVKPDWMQVERGSLLPAITGSGTPHALQASTASGSHWFHPWHVFKPTQAAMSPARISLTSSRLLACI